MNLMTWEFTGGPFHFGRRGLGQEVTAAGFSSDSLFAALVSRLADLEGAKAIDAFMEPFLNGLSPFVLSSLFPRAAGIRFFPVPAFRSKGELKTGISHKDMKKVRFLSEKLFKRVIGGEDLAAIYPDTCKFQGGSLLADASEAKEIPSIIWKEEKRPRVTLDRQSQQSTLFFTGEVHFSPGCGLWMAAEIRDASILTRLDSLLNEVGEAGLGADRSAGLGRCSVVRGNDLDLPEPKPDGFMVTLGRFLPKKDEALTFMKEGCAYKLETIGGWITSPLEMNQRRRIVRMVSEGAVLGSLPSPAGDLVDVRPVYGGKAGLDHPVWRNGQVLAAAYLPPVKGDVL
ncbi:MAG: type III-A CRISPR-associated RAMP protein Csm4 [Leptolinea sp.]|jgi:CRISPR-associated protein Csm4|nr:type III-A CRISPR-associated RAMP protein Csm4 [Leptolinea sp.]